MIRRVLVLACFCVLALPVVAPAFADNAKDKLSQVESAMNKRKEEEARLADQAREQSATLAALRQKLITASDALAQKQEEQSQLEDKEDELAEDITAKRTALAEERHKINALVMALLELGRQPPETLLLQHGLTTDHIHRTIYLRAILPRLREEAEALLRDLSLLHDLKVKMAEQQRLLAASTANLNEQRQKLDELVKARQGLLQKTEAQKADIQRQLSDLTDQAQDLRQLLEKVTPKKSPKAAPQAGAAPSLKWPVAGNQIRHFGDRDADGVRSEGIAFAALPGAPVVAPAAGKVVFAGPFKGYGPIVILQHKGGYHSFLAGFGRIDCDLGDEVETGEPLGVMPVKTGAKPELYFEWRRNNEPVDPAAARNP